MQTRKIKWQILSKPTFFKQKIFEIMKQIIKISKKLSNNERVKEKYDRMQKQHN